MAFLFIGYAFSGGILINSLRGNNFSGAVILGGGEAQSDCRSRGTLGQHFQKAWLNAARL